MIPVNLSYVQHLKRYEKELAQAGIHHAHGLCHAYAQRRYQTLAGWPCPIQGGPARKALLPEQKELDEKARQIISGELGHGRISIVARYIGS